MADTRVWKVLSVVLAIGLALALLVFPIYESVQQKDLRSSLEKRDEMDTMMVNVSVNALVREAAELALWIKNNEPFVHIEDNVEDGEKIEVLQDNYEYFYGELVANLVRLGELTQIARQLTNLSDSKTALQIQTKMKDLNQKLTSFRELVSAHEVERFYQDINRTMDWIEEERNSLKTEQKLLDSVESNYNNKRKIFKLFFDARRDRLLAAKSHKIHQLDKAAARLIKDHPDAAVTILFKLKKLEKEWILLTAKAKQ